MKSDRTRWRFLLMALVAVVLAIGVAACGDDDDEGDGGGDTPAQAEGGQIESNPDNGSTTITVGSKNFTEQIVLGEIYAQALEAAGYKVEKDLNLGSEQIARKALRRRDLGLPRVHLDGAHVVLRRRAGPGAGRPPGRGRPGGRGVREGGAGLVRADAVRERQRGRHAEEHRRRARGDQGLRPRGQVPGPDPLRVARSAASGVDCLVGLEDPYGLEFKEFKPVDIELRYTVLDKGQADLSILFTTDAAARGRGRQVRDPRGRPERLPRGERRLRDRRAGGRSRPGPTTRRRSSSSRAA